MSDLRDAAAFGVEMLIRHFDDINKVSERFCGYNTAVALEDIFEKGLKEFLDMCDMDDKLAETEAQMQQPRNGLVTAFNKGFFGGE